MMWGNGMGWGAWLLMALTTVGFWALVVFGIVTLFRGTGGAGPRERVHDQGARQILDERFARGEIDKAEYLEKKELISQRAPVRKADQPDKEPEAPESPETAPVEEDLRLE